MDHGSRMPCWFYNRSACDYLCWRYSFYLNYCPIDDAAFSVFEGPVYWMGQFQGRTVDVMWSSRERDFPGFRGAHGESSLTWWIADLVGLRCVWCRQLLQRIGAKNGLSSRRENLELVMFDYVAVDSFCCDGSCPILDWTIVAKQELWIKTR